MPGTVQVPPLKPSLEGPRNTDSIVRLRIVQCTTGEASPQEQELGKAFERISLSQTAKEKHINQMREEGGRAFQSILAEGLAWVKAEDRGGTFGTHKPSNRTGVQYGVGHKVREGTGRPRARLQ